MKNTKIALGFNVAIVLLVFGAVLYMMTGSIEGGLVAYRFDVFKFFTVDSNVLMGIASLVIAIEQIMVCAGKKKEVSLFALGLVIASTCGVTITMLVTVFYLTPLMYSSLGFSGLFGGANFILHLLVPILSIVVLLAFERTDRMSFKFTFISIIPFGVYSIYYITLTLLHMKGGVIEDGYDWYWFFHLGGIVTVVSLIGVILLAYGIGFALWKLNRIKTKKRKSEGENKDE